MRVRGRKRERERERGGGGKEREKGGGGDGRDSNTMPDFLHVQKVSKTMNLMNLNKSFL